MIPISFNLCFNILVNQAVPGHMSHRGLLECFTVTGFVSAGRSGAIFPYRNQSAAPTGDGLLIKSIS